jgi:outer membrane lipoprotein-sorting protein
MRKRTDLDDNGAWELMMGRAEATPAFGDEQSRRVLERIRRTVGEPSPSPASEKSLPDQSNRREGSIMRWIHRGLAGRAGWAVGLAVLAVILAIMAGVNPWNRGSSRAYAMAVEQLRTARTMTYKMTTATKVDGAMPAMTIEMAYKEPGHLRQTMNMMGAKAGVTVFDLTLKRAITLMPPTKEYMEMDLSELPSDMSQINVMEEMRKLPDQADEELGERELDGRIARGFRVIRDGIDQKVWVDPETEYLVRVEGEFVNMRGMHVVMADFQFDVELDDALFSLTPPEGYKPLNLKVDVSAFTEEDLLKYLRWWGERHRDGLFPPSLNPVELAKYGSQLGKEGKFLETEKVKGMTKEEGRRMAMEQSMQLTRGAMFAMQMKPENDFHYAGDGVRLGDAEMPICWWKPSTQEASEESKTFRTWTPGDPDAYRVIYGDLSIRDVNASQLPPDPQTP